MALREPALSAPFVLAFPILVLTQSADPPRESSSLERAAFPGAQLVQLTNAPHGHILANRSCWSPDGQWLYFDLRRDETVFDGREIQRVRVDNGSVESVLQAPADSFVGVPTTNDVDHRLVALRSPIAPDSAWTYTAWHRCGLIGNAEARGAFEVLDARDVTPPFTAGALRGGTHLHMLNAKQDLVSSTYEDRVLATNTTSLSDENRRVVAVTDLSLAVSTPKYAGDLAARNQDGFFTAVVTEVVNDPQPGSDQIARAYSDAWIAHTRSIAFFGEVVASDGQRSSELFVVDLPDDLTKAAANPLCGTPTTRPGVPAGVTQRRLTHTGSSKAPGVQGPRHWPVSTPDGSLIGFYARNDAGKVCFYTVPPVGGPAHQVTDGEFEPTSSFTWNASGTAVTFVADGSVFIAEVPSGRTHRMTPKQKPGPRHHACVFSPTANRVAFMQTVSDRRGDFDQIFLVTVPKEFR